MEHDDGSPALTRPDKPDDDLIESLAESIDLRRAVEQLARRDRRLVQLRFVDELTQQEVGKVLGVSQMQVSRLLVRLLDSPAPQPGPGRRRGTGAARPAVRRLTADADPKAVEVVEPPVGIEPTTYSLRVNRSGRLS